MIGIRPQGIMPLMQDTSVGDPPSVGVAVLIANWTKTSRPDEALNDYNDPLLQQLNYLFSYAPKTSDGAISHRSEQVQLWYVMTSISAQVALIADRVYLGNTGPISST